MERTRILRTLETTGEEVIQVKLNYVKGGIYQFNRQMEERGLVVMVKPVIIKHEELDGMKYTTTSYMGFSGVKQQVHMMKRFNQKVFDEFVPEKQLILDMINHVLHKNNLKLKEVYHS